MTLEQHSSTRQLIAKVESKDRKFRMAQAVFMAIIFVILAGVIVVQLRTLNGVQEQLKQQEILLNEQKKNTDEIKNTTANVSKQIDCIAQFFAMRNRTEVTIEDLENCRIVRPDGTIVDLPLAPRNTAGPNTPAQSNPQPTSPGSGQTPSNPQQPGPTEPPILPPVDPPVDPPVEILGVPACVPFTGICVR